METTHVLSEFNELTQLDPIDRWSVYHRLLDLAIPCSCQTGQPLRVSVQNTLSAIQLWSVVQQVTASRREKAAWLDLCWER